MLSNVTIVSHLTESICSKNAAHDATVLAIFRAATFAFTRAEYLVVDQSEAL